MRYERNTVGTIRSGILVGARVKVLRQSKRTGNLIVEMLEDRKAYETGSWVDVPPSEFVPLTETR